MVLPNGYKINHDNNNNNTYKLVDSGTMRLYFDSFDYIELDFISYTHWFNAFSTEYERI